MSIATRAEVVDNTKKILQPFYDDETIQKDEFKDIARTVGREVKAPCSVNHLKSAVLTRVILALEKRDGDASKMDDVKTQLKELSTDSAPVAETQPNTLQTPAPEQAKKGPSLQGLKGFLKKRKDEGTKVPDAAPPAPAPLAPTAPAPVQSVAVEAPLPATTPTTNVAEKPPAPQPDASEALEAKRVRKEETAPSGPSSNAVAPVVVPSPKQAKDEPKKSRDEDDDLYGDLGTTAPPVPPPATTGQLPAAFTEIQPVLQTASAAATASAATAPSAILPVSSMPTQQPAGFPSIGLVPPMNFNGYPPQNMYGTAPAPSGDGWDDGFGAAPVIPTPTPAPIIPSVPQAPIMAPTLSREEFEKLRMQQTGGAVQ